MIFFPSPMIFVLTEKPKEHSPDSKENESPPKSISNTKSGNSTPNGTRKNKRKKRFRRGRGEMTNEDQDIDQQESKLLDGKLTNSSPPKPMRF